MNDFHQGREIVCTITWIKYIEYKNNTSYLVGMAEKMIAQYFKKEKEPNISIESSFYSISNKMYTKYAYQTKSYWMSKSSD